MKKFFLGLLLLTSAAGTLSSCKDDDKIPAPDREDLPLIIPRFHDKDTVTSFINREAAAAPRNTNTPRPVVEFEINPSNADQLQTVEVYKTYGSSPNATFTLFTLSPRVLAEKYDTFPAKFSQNSEQILTGLTRGGVALIPNGDADRYNNFTVNSAVIFTFEYILKDGRRIVLTPLDRNGAITGTFANAPYALQVFAATSFGTLPVKPQY